METIAGSQVLQDLEASKKKWARLPVRDKTGFLREVRRLTVQHAPDWAEAGARLKGFRGGGPDPV